jgi:hypothetical protein
MTGREMERSTYSLYLILRRNHPTASKAAPLIRAIGPGRSIGRPTPADKPAADSDHESAAAVRWKHYGRLSR